MVALLPLEEGRCAQLVGQKGLGESKLKGLDRALKVGQVSRKAEVARQGQPTLEMALRITALDISAAAKHFLPSDLIPPIVDLHAGLDLTNAAQQEGLPDQGGGNRGRTTHGGSLTIDDGCSEARFDQTQDQDQKHGYSVDWRLEQDIGLVVDRHGDEGSDPCGFKGLIVQGSLRGCATENAPGARWPARAISRATMPPSSAR